MADFLNEVPQECAAYTNAWTTLQKIFQQLGGKGTCEVSRYLIPVPWLHDAFDGVAGWISSEQNVQLSTQCADAPSTDAFCAVLALG